MERVRIAKLITNTLMGRVRIVKSIPDTLMERVGIEVNPEHN